MPTGQEKLVNGIALDFKEIQDSPRKGQDSRLQNKRGTKEEAMEIIGYWGGMKK